MKSGFALCGGGIGHKREGKDSSPPPAIPPQECWANLEPELPVHSSSVKTSREGFLISKIRYTGLSLSTIYMHPLMPLR